MCLNPVPPLAVQVSHLLSNVMKVSKSSEEIRWASDEQRTFDAVNILTLIPASPLSASAAYGIQS